MTVEQYLAMERRLETRNEYRDGEVVEVSGGGARHNRAVMDVVFPLHQQLRETPWEVYFLQMRMRTPDRKWYLYPDVLIPRIPPEFEDLETDTLVNPLVIVDVITPTSRDFVLGTKFALYRSIPSLFEYVAVALDRIHIEHYLRQANGSWLMIELADLDRTLELPSVGCRLSLAEIYERAFQSDR